MAQVFWVLLGSKLACGSCDVFFSPLPYKMISGHNLDFTDKLLSQDLI